MHEPPSLQSLPPIDFASELNEEQFAAVKAKPGPALVLAGAGSGKTRTLTYRVAWLLHQGVAPWNILLLTFTNKAAREMLDRVEDLTGVSKRAFWGGTFHSIGQRLLRANADKVELSSSFSIMDQSDAESLFTEAVKSVDKDYTKQKENPKPKALFDLISYSRNTLQGFGDMVQNRYPLHDGIASKVSAFAKAYEQKKREQQLVDYDDLLVRWNDLLKDDAVATHYSNKFKHILVDEYQDTNILQGQIIDRLGGHHNIMAVGDDAQCIYTWRGAELNNILNFPQRHPGTEIYKIETNYRSTPEILSFANESLQHQPSGIGYEKTLKPIRESRQVPLLVPLMDPTLQAHFILKRIQGLLNEGYRPGDICILYRAHYQSMDVQMELSRQSVPYIITSGVRFFEQAHIRDLAAHLRFVVNPSDSVAFSRMLTLLPKVGPKGASNLFKLAQDVSESQAIPICKALQDEKVLKKVPAVAKEDYIDLVYTLENLSQALCKDKAPPGQIDLFENAEKPPLQDTPLPPNEIVRIAIEGWYGDYMPNLYPKNWHNRRDDLESLIGFASQYENMEDLLSELVLLNSETSDRSSEITDDYLRLSTIHQAKGLEFPVVFIISLAQGYFPLKRAIEEGNIEEERRLFYVGVTRAKDELYLTWPRIGMQNGSPTQMDASLFIQEVDPQKSEVLHTR